MRCVLHCDQCQHTSASTMLANHANSNVHSAWEVTINDSCFVYKYLEIQCLYCKIIKSLCNNIGKRPNNF